MRLLVVIALVCIVGACAFPQGGGGYYGGGGGMESGFGNYGNLDAGGMNNGVFDQADSGFRRIEEGHNTRNFGANNNMGHINRGGGSQGFGRGGSNMFGGGGYGGPMLGPIG